MATERKPVTVSSRPALAAFAAWGLAAAKLLSFDSAAPASVMTSSLPSSANKAELSPGISRARASGRWGWRCRYVARSFDGCSSNQSLQHRRAAIVSHDVTQKAAVQPRWRTNTGEASCSPQFGGASSRRSRRHPEVSGITGKMPGQQCITAATEARRYSDSRPASPHPVTGRRSSAQPPPAVRQAPAVHRWFASR